MKVNCINTESKRGYDEIEIDLLEVNTISSTLRLVGVDKSLIKLTNKSFKELKRELEKRNLLSKLSLEKR